ncbi:MAG: polysaccharide deacetylase family protein [Chitinophagales bacterium]
MEIETLLMLDALLFTKTPGWLKALYPDCTWRVDTGKKAIYLTFDDGPIPEVTPFVLDELKKWKAKATFFCIGKNIEAHPQIFKRILKEGHSIGNHTQDHLSGWKHQNKTYLSNITRCDESIKTVLDSKLKQKHSKPLFRPPYGKLKPSQYKALKDKYRIVMWDVLTYDFDLKIPKSRVLKAALKHTEAGSIIVFHDSLKAKSKVEYALPLVLEHFSREGYTFAAL